MKFYFNDGGCFDILENILYREKITYNYEYEDDTTCGSVVWTPFGASINYKQIKCIVIDTDLEHYDFIKFLLKKELKKEKKKDKMLKKLENCYKLTTKNTKKKDDKQEDIITTTSGVTITINHSSNWG